ncbi:MAG: hypothetical protein LBF41_05330 [Deltaproteobacteria bacterium]|jgi:TPR repeat protein|nr:hypothetical protein [Deltaproteobacteria bacterium]
MTDYDSNDSSVSRASDVSRFTSGTCPVPANGLPSRDRADVVAIPLPPKLAKEEPGEREKAAAALKVAVMADIFLAARKIAGLRRFGTRDFSKQVDFLWLYRRTAFDASGDSRSPTRETFDDDKRELSDFGKTLLALTADLFGNSATESAGRADPAPMDSPGAEAPEVLALPPDFFNEALDLTLPRPLSDGKAFPDKPTFENASRPASDSREENSLEPEVPAVPFDPWEDASDLALPGPPSDGKARPDKPSFDDVSQTPTDVREEKTLAPESLPKWVNTPVLTEAEEDSGLPPDSWDDASDLALPGPPARGKASLDKSSSEDASLSPADRGNTKAPTSPAKFEKTLVLTEITADPDLPPDLWDDASDPGLPFDPRDEPSDLALPRPPADGRGNRDKPSFGASGRTATSRKMPYVVEISERQGKDFVKVVPEATREIKPPKPGMLIIKAEDLERVKREKMTLLKEENPDYARLRACDRLLGLLNKARVFDNGSTYYRIAKHYEIGKGVNADPGEALRWYLVAGEKDNKGALYRAGRICHFGIGVPQDLERARELYRMAAVGHNTLAQACYAHMCHKGEGGPKNEKLAKSFFKKSEATENSFYLGMMGYKYENGEDLPRSMERAVRFYRLAAERGNENARNRLCEILCQQMIANEEKNAVAAERRSNGRETITET